MAAAANLELTRRSPLLTTDSASYLSAAENLSSGKGLTTSFNDSLSVYHPREVVAFNGRVPFVHFEPLYPLLLAALHGAGLGELGAARLIGVTSLVVIVLLLCALASRAFQGCLPLVLVFVLITVIGPSGKGFVAGNLVELSGEVLSEPVFYAFSLGALLTCALFLDKGSRRYLVSTSAPRRRRNAHPLRRGKCGARRRYRHRHHDDLSAPESREECDRRAWGSDFVAVVGWPLVERWLSGGASPRQIAFHLHPHLLTDFLATAASWFFPTGWPSWLTDSGAVVLLVIAAIAPCPAVVSGSSGAPRVLPLRRKTSCGCLAIFLLSYAFVVFVSSTWLDASLSLDQRVLGPMQVASYLILLSLVYWAVRSRWAVDFRFAPLAVTLGVALLLIVPNVCAGRPPARPSVPDARPDTGHGGPAQASFP